MATRILLAAVDDDGGIPFMGLTPSAREELIMFGALFVVILLVTIWILARQRRNRRHSHRHDRPALPANNTLSKTAENRSRRRRNRHKQHQQHSENFKSNPTLAETGGLPPKRTTAPLSPPKPAAPPQQA